MEPKLSLVDLKIGKIYRFVGVGVMGVYSDAKTTHACKTVPNGFEFMAIKNEVGSFSYSCKFIGTTESIIGWFMFYGTLDGIRSSVCFCEVVND